MASPFDIRCMARALQLAHRAVYAARPNPAVGCVLARDSTVIGEGYTRPAGGNHAEIEALAACSDARGATAYVTLEPCSHQGRTGPCADALLSAGIATVHIAVRDPNPAVKGQGIARLKAAGVTVHEGLLAEQSEAVNRGFFQRMRTGMPRVRAKLASSLDGRTAMESGESQWITGAAARADVQRLRALSAAIVTGVATVCADDPALTVRNTEFDIPSPPLRVVLDSQLRTPVTAKLLREPGETLVVHTSQASAAPALSDAGAELLLLPGVGDGVSLRALLEELGRRQCNDILVECGARLAGAFLAEDLLDEIVLYLAPTLLGSSARPQFQLPIETMAEKRDLQITDMRQVGEDIRITCSPVS
jgi:diaminohydroxyphosphoribosylaminopyrimidine deaminase/5-amino-6-(5-phosphoribosylamino)uracil reductase